MILVAVTIFWISMMNKLYYGCCFLPNKLLKLKYIHHYFSFFLKFVTKKSRCILRASASYGPGNTVLLLLHKKFSGVLLFVECVHRLRTVNSFIVFQHNTKQVHNFSSLFKLKKKIHLGIKFIKHFYLQLPILACSNGKFKDFLLANVPILQEKYWPTLWCFESRAQTVLASLLRSRLLPNIKYQR
jgi:hypothetical protein